MNKNLIFTKNNIEYSFRNPEITRYGELEMEYKILGIKENDMNDGYFCCSKFLVDKGAMTFYDVKVDGKKVSGVLLPADILEEVKSLYIQLKTERQENIQKIINEIVAGKRNISFSIVGCDFPHYQAWLKNLPKDLEGQEQELMEKAIKTIMGDDESVFNSCDYIKNRVKKSIGTLETLGEVINPRFDLKTQEYHGYSADIVTHFELSLPSILKSKIEKRAKDQSRIIELFNKAKETGERQLLKQWWEDCTDEEESCDIDILCEYAMPDGTTKIERTHCW